MERPVEQGDSFERRQGQFEMLRDQVHRESEGAVLRRVRENPLPTDDEILAGCYRENIEMQVRDALFAMREKGYSTYQSGFYGIDGSHDAQYISGIFAIDIETRKKLADMGVQVLEREEEGSSIDERDVVFIKFKAEEPDLQKIKEKWDAIVRVFPSLGKAVKPIQGTWGEHWPNDIVTRKYIWSRMVAMDESLHFLNEKERVRVKRLIAASDSEVETLMREFEVEDERVDAQ